MILCKCSSVTLITDIMHRLEILKSGCRIYTKRLYGIDSSSQSFKKGPILVFPVTHLATNSCQTNQMISSDIEHLLTFCAGSLVCFYIFHCLFYSICSNNWQIVLKWNMLFLRLQNISIYLFLHLQHFLFRRKFGDLWKYICFATWILNCNIWAGQRMKSKS